jgi:hypothetical protein
LKFRLDLPLTIFENQIVWDLIFIDPKKGQRNFNEGSRFEKLSGRNLGHRAHHFGSGMAITAVTAGQTMKQCGQRQTGQDA